MSKRDAVLHVIESPQSVLNMFNPVAVLFFDMALTFSTEVDYIWRKSLSTSSVVFFLNRYISAFANLVYGALLTQKMSEKASAITSRLLATHLSDLCFSLSCRGLLLLVVKNESFSQRSINVQLPKHPYLPAGLLFRLTNPRGV